MEQTDVRKKKESRPWAKHEYYREPPPADQARMAQVATAVASWEIAMEAQGPVSVIVPGRRLEDYKTRFDYIEPLALNTTKTY